MQGDVTGQIPHGAIFVRDGLFRISTGSMDLYFSVNHWLSNLRSSMSEFSFRG
jgi:hypothetical protein